MYAYERKLTGETVFVGTSLIPLYLVIDKVVGEFKPSPTTQKILSIFLSGCAFHLISETVGLNNWYLRNGAVLEERSKSLPNYKMPKHMCDGTCGWYETDTRMFSHELFHA